MISRKESVIASALFEKEKHPPGRARPEHYVLSARDESRKRDPHQNRKKEPDGSQRPKRRSNQQEGREMGKRLQYFISGKGGGGAEEHDETGETPPQGKKKRKGERPSHEVCTP